MSHRQKTEGATAYREGSKRSNNPHAFGTTDWTDWKDGFDQAEAEGEREVIQDHVAERMAKTG